MENILNDINFPNDLKNLTESELIELAKEIRSFLVDSVSKTGGHLGANLGVVELTIALHKVFNTPDDKIVWDIGHQGYIHKILTGRKNQFNTLRKKGGLSGFLKIKESEFDVIGAGHSSTSISAALGINEAFRLQNKNNKVLAVIGDASIGSGMALEALNHCGYLKSNLVVILNDNNKSIAETIGALRTYITKISTSKMYFNFRENMKKIMDKTPNFFADFVKDIEKYIRVSGSNLFEDLGFFYLGPIDGHDFSQLLPILQNIKENEFNIPIFLHVVTKKGKGYSYAEKASDNYHGVTKFDVDTGKFIDEKKGDNKTYIEVFSEKIVELAKSDDKVLAITAAMPQGSGLVNFASSFPKRYFDVGIAEQHGVTFSAGLAIEGFKPYVSIYSTFMQRAYDQVVHDVLLQDLPVKFIIPNHGFVGADGVTHMGALTLNMFLCLPNSIIMIPYFAEDLIQMLDIANNLDKPSFILLSKELAAKKSINKDYILEKFKGEVLHKGKDVAIISFGSNLGYALKARELLLKEDINISVIDIKFLKPVDEKLIVDTLNAHKLLITVEDGYMGGFSSVIYDVIAKNNLEKKCIYKPLAINSYIEQGNIAEQRKEANLDEESIANFIKMNLNKIF